MAATRTNIRDEAVQAKTGKTWSQWFKLLDRAGCETRTHKEIVAVLKAKHAGIGSWWQQMVTVAYEQARGLRDKHERPDGFSVSGSRTINVSVGKLYRAFKDGRARTRWLGETGLVVRKATENRSMRITWSDGSSSVSVNFYSKGRGRAQVSVNHDKLKNRTEANRLKMFWSERLDVLRESLQT